MPSSTEMVECSELWTAPRWLDSQLKPPSGICTPIRKSTMDCNDAAGIAK